MELNKKMTLFQLIKILIKKKRLKLRNSLVNSQSRELNQLPVLTKIIKLVQKLWLRVTGSQMAVLHTFLWLCRGIKERSSIANIKSILWYLTIIKYLQATTPAQNSSSDIYTVIK